MNKKVSDHNKKGQIYQIDQSGKVEDTRCHTVIACVNGLQRSVLLPAREKRKLLEWFRVSGKPRLFVDFVFSTLVYLLIKPMISHSLKTFVVDIEYPGRTQIITRIIQEFSHTTLLLRWELVGKSSRAHDIAYKTYKKKIKATRVISGEEIWRLTKKIAGGRLNAGLSPANRRSAPANIHNISKKQPFVKEGQKKNKP